MWYFTYFLTRLHHPGERETKKLRAINTFTLVEFFFKCRKGKDSISHVELILNWEKPPIIGDGGWVEIRLGTDLSTSCLCWPVSHQVCDFLETGVRFELKTSVHNSVLYSIRTSKSMTAYRRMDERKLWPIASDIKSSNW